MFFSRVTDEKYLQWQCKKTCNLCNTDPSAKEMDEICNAYLGPEIRAKYQQNIKPARTKPTKPSRDTPIKITIRQETKRPKKPTTRKPDNKKQTKNKANSNKNKFKPSKKNNINKKNKGKGKKNSKQASRKEAPRSSGGFVVVTDPKRRAQLRSFWTRRG